MNREAVMNAFFTALNTYYSLEKDTMLAFEKLVRIREIPAGTNYLSADEVPVFISYIYKGLFSYYFQYENGDTVIKKFFPENTFVASTSALIMHDKSRYTIDALEDSIVVEYSFAAFNHLLQKHHDLALFWINYLGKHWVVEKEHQEIEHKYLPAKERYRHFVAASPALAARLQLQQIASFLGITPTQLSRIRKTL
ncbi:Crp/Fnr family transcriptional regulator [Chitinophaga silvisoli]|uniref:Crp/Fnr family transcriptional regulator n=1 Tax=Chitinophaga silvisoli TaxID=2291814 RepID=A0A3E1P1G8_9BACT|nr:Crp/Fnr family transcriptional regulator [Chitinophaga silvisoli]RFM34016.1 Crp/Fnr family transcriptional regulator [Chitinophaga silvisoli]